MILVQLNLILTENKYIAQKSLEIKQLMGQRRNQEK